MQTFTATLSSAEYTEILQGGSGVAFDCNSAGEVRLILSMTATQPAVDAAHTIVRSWPDSWDFAAENMAGGQRVWVRADDNASGVIITGVRG